MEDLETCLNPTEILVCGRHIHIATCEVAFPWVGWFPIQFVVCAFAYLGPTIASVTASYRSHRIVAFGGVDLALARHQVIEILVSLVAGTSPPTLREGVLDVHTRTHCAL